MQMDFVSVERVVELLHLEQEPPGDVDPPAWWPSYNGDIVFEDVTIRYAPHLDPSLSDISFRIPAGSTTALLGRTGSGKSTLALSLLAIMKPESGRILIDNIDISIVNTQTLRNRIVRLPFNFFHAPSSLPSLTKLPLLLHHYSPTTDPLHFLNQSQPTYVTTDIPRPRTDPLPRNPTHKPRPPIPALRPRMLLRTTPYCKRSELDTRD